MTRLRDHIEQIERALDKGGLPPLDRRLLLRKVLRAVADEAFAEGHHEGMCDALDAQRAAKEADDG